MIELRSRIVETLITDPLKTHGAVLVTGPILVSYWMAIPLAWSTSINSPRGSRRRSEDQESWKPRPRSRIRLAATPKRHLADPSLAVAAPGADGSVLGAAGPTQKNTTPPDEPCMRGFTMFE